MYILYLYMRVRSKRAITGLVQICKEFLPSVRLRPLHLRNSIRNDDRVGPHAVAQRFKFGRGNRNVIRADGSTMFWGMWHVMHIVMSGTVVGCELNKEYETLQNQRLQQQGLELV